MTAGVRGDSEGRKKHRTNRRAKREKKKGRKRGSGELVTVCPRQPEIAVQRSGGQSSAAKISTHLHTHRACTGSYTLHQDFHLYTGHNKVQNIHMHTDSIQCAHCNNFRFDISIARCPQVMLT